MSKSNSSVILGVIGHWVWGGVEGGNVILGVIGQCGVGGLGDSREAGFSTSVFRKCVQGPSYFSTVYFVIQVIVK